VNNIDINAAQYNKGERDEDNRANAAQWNRADGKESMGV
jgi:hypothetical protein